MSNNPNNNQPKYSVGNPFNTFRFSRKSHLYLPEHHIPSGVGDDEHAKSKYTFSDALHKWVTLLVALGTIWVLITQTQIMNKQADIMTETLPPLIEQAKAATKASKTADQTLKAFEQAERAWVGIRSVNVPKPPTEGQPLAIRINVINGGKTPAILAQAATVFMLWMTAEGDETLPPNNDPKIRKCLQPKPKWSDSPGGTLLVPGVTSLFIEEQSPVVTKSLAELFTKRELPLADFKSPDFKNIPRAKSVRADKWNIISFYLLGCIDYFDQVKTAHRTSLCYIYGPSEVEPQGALSACSKGNFAD